MFEKYTEKARRAIFFARYEASQCGAREIGTPCLLLGIARENRDLMARLIPAGSSDIPKLRADLEALLPKAQKIATSVDLPLSHASNRALAYAKEECELLQHDFIDTGHLLLGLLREEGAETACLKARGIEMEGVRTELARAAAETSRDAEQALKLDETRRRTELLRAFTELPPDRLQAGLTLLKALASDKFEVTGTGPDGPFHFSFGGEPE
jgi:ATP-dependent Clp protease ATP-binding subunit ClpC